MEDTIEPELTREEATHLRELIEECLTKIKQAHEAMAQDRAEIEQLQAETRAIINRSWKAA